MKSNRLEINAQIYWVFRALTTHIRAFTLFGMIIVVRITTYSNMMKQLIITTSFLLTSFIYCNAQTSDHSSNDKYAIEEPNNSWILDFVDSIRNTTDLCTNCDSPPH